MRKKEERLNTINSFANGFKIIRDSKIITLTPEELTSTHREPCGVAISYIATQSE